jgi:hypothetical protein
MTRHWKLISGIAGVLALVGLATGLAIGLSGSTAKRAASPTGLSISQQLRLEKGITAPTVTAQADVVATDVRSQFEGRDKPLLPPGSRLSIDSATFHSFSPQLATVNAVVSGPSVGHWQLVLVREAGEWLLLGSRKLS